MGGFKKEIVKYLEQVDKVKTPNAKRQNIRRAENAFQSYLERLRTFRVLDPACGSGNFLYLALRTLKDLEHRANVEAEALGLQRQFPLVGPACVQGIEINAYAAELARVTVWIGEIQWMLQHGYQPHSDPILRPLETIEQRDAIISASGSEPSWPSVDVIIGNPPFLGNKKMLREARWNHTSWVLGDLYKGRLSGGVDLVAYWFQKALQQVRDNGATRVGLVATNSIRGGANREVLESICEHACVFNAWSDMPWVNEGAAVRVSLIAFESNKSIQPRLDDKPVDEIFSDLTAHQHSASVALDLTKAQKLIENGDVSFQGVVLIGKFDIPGEIARQWLHSPNPNGLPNRNVIRPLTNGKDITSRSRDMWVIDFGDMDMDAAAGFEQPFEHVREHVQPTRAKNPRKKRREHWWIHGETGSGWRSKIQGLQRYIATSQVSKHRFFVWRHPSVWPHQTVIAFAHDDDAFFGILHSRHHRLWAARTGTSLEDRPRYTPTTTFETFPFPEGLTPDLTHSGYSNEFVDEVSAAGAHLNQLRENWLNPNEWTQRIPEEADGYPVRVIAINDHDRDLAKRTLTRLYNEQPTWLESAHQRINEAVSRAYGWEPDLEDDEVLSRLLELNRQRSS